MNTNTNAIAISPDSLVWTNPAGAVQTMPRDAAMRAYAQFGGSLRAPDAGGPTRAGDIDNAARDRIMATEARAASVGIVLPPPVFAAGSRCRSDGDARLASERMAWDFLPSAQDAIAEGIARIKAERRRDTLPVRVSDLALSPDGDLYGPSGHRVGVEIGALEGLARFAGIKWPGLSGRDYGLTDVPMGLLAETWAQLRHHAGDTHVRLRLRTAADGREAAYAAVSPTYLRHDADATLRDLSDVVGRSDLRGVVEYTPGTTRLSVHLLHHLSPSDLPNFSAGDVTAAGVRLSTRDDAGGAIRWRAEVLRNLCLNYIIVGTATGAAGRAVHKGRSSTFLRTLNNGIRKAYGAASTVLPQIERLASTDADTILTGDDRARAVTIAGLYRGADVARDVIVEAILSGRAYEPDDTSIAGYVNAITRIHADKGASAKRIADLELVAGELVPILAKAADAGQLLSVPS